MALDPAMLRSLLKIFLTDLVQQGDFLTDALLVLEQAEPADANHADDGARREAYAAVMRSAHNLKGGARSLGLVEVEAVFHAMDLSSSAPNIIPFFPFNILYDITSDLHFS